ncbi:MAG: endonuclease domain-containing protein [Candidatus Dojkabacteria bacterium]
MITNPLTSKPKLLKYARDLRKHSTPSERMLWKRLKNSQLNNMKFRRQYPVVNYILDFYSPELRLAIEINGSTHNEDKFDYDRKREKELIELGIKVIKFTEYQVKTRLDEVMQTLYLSTLTSPQSYLNEESVSLTSPQSSP